MKTPIWKNALAVVGAASLVLAGVGGAAGLLAAKRGFSARDEPSTLEVVAARAMRGLAASDAVKKAVSPLAPTAAHLEEGLAHFADHCASCHANDGSGDTPLGRNLYPRAPDMRAEPTQSLTDGELYDVIQNGVRLTGMPAWGTGQPGDVGTWQLVAFIRHLPALTDGELQQMKGLNPRSREAFEKAQAEDDFLNEPPQHH